MPGPDHTKSIAEYRLIMREFEPRYRAATPAARVEVMNEIADEIRSDAKRTRARLPSAEDFPNVCYLSVFHCHSPLMNPDRKLSTTTPITELPPWMMAPPLLRPVRSGLPDWLPTISTTLRSRRRWPSWGHWIHMKGSHNGRLLPPRLSPAWMRGRWLSFSSLRRDGMMRVHPDISKGGELVWHAVWHS